MGDSKNKPAVINAIWLILIVAAVLVGMARGTMEQVQSASFDSAKSAVQLAINLIGVMALWLGLMKIAEAGGLMRMIARAIRPLMIRLFPDVPAEHPAMAAMIMNMAANMLGLGNAATPLGIKAMMELNKLNRRAGRATKAMCLFLAINTSSVTILPLGVIGVRAAAGAAEPAAVMIPTMIATLISTAVAITAAKLFEVRSRRLDALAGEMKERTAEAPSEEVSDDSNAEKEENLGDEADTDTFNPGKLGRILVWCTILAVPAMLIYRLALAEDPSLIYREALRFWIVPVLMLIIVAFGYLRGVKVYEVATEGAKEGFQVAVRIIPFLVMILVAIGMFKASGAFDMISGVISPLTNLIGLPADVLPMALMRPLSGSGAFGLMAELSQQAPDSLSAYMAGLMQGSTETTFYVLAVYFGEVGITRVRYAIAAALIADLAGIVSAVVLAQLTY